MESWLNLEGKSIIVTGAASGIGFATAKELLNDGANVTVCDLAETAPDFGETAGKLLYVRTDVTKKESVDAMVAKVVETFGGIDAIVNNAGINIPRLLVDEGNQYELDEAVFDKVMNVNVKGLFFCSQAAARVMVKASRARRDYQYVLRVRLGGLGRAERLRRQQERSQRLYPLLGKGTRQKEHPRGRRCPRDSGSNRASHHFL